MLATNFIQFIFFLAINLAFYSASSIDIKKTDFVTYNKFDIIAKYIYAKNNNLSVSSNWPTKLYQEHLCTLGKLTEPNLKNDTQDKKVFDALLEAIKGESSNEAIQSLLLQNSSLDESHTLAAFLLYNKKLPLITSLQASTGITTEYLKANNTHCLDEIYVDAMALQYCELKGNTYIALLFPCVKNMYNIIEKIFNNFGTIVYTKDVELSQQGAFNLIRIAYENAKYIGNYENNFLGARINTGKRFLNRSSSGLYPIKAILFECKNLATVRECKKTIRDLFNYGPYPIHINDTHEETLILSRTFFHKNSIDFLNRAQFKNFDHFDKYIAAFKYFITKNRFNQECFCVDGSAIMAAYGLRDCGDIDFLHHGYDFLPKQLKSHPIIHSHNIDTMRYHAHEKDEIIFNPENYFYYKNLKFATLQELRATKLNRLLKKDPIDVDMINACLDTPLS